VAIRAPGAFRAIALVQSAHPAHRNAELASRLASAGPGKGPLPALVLTSEGDPFRDRNLALAAELEKRGVPTERRKLPGPHDQPWLREAGTLEMLHWLDRRPRSP
jgi:acetyl esterase/lipase